MVDGATTVVKSGDVVDPSNPGTYTERYNSSDAAGNAATEVLHVVTVLDVLDGQVIVPKRFALERKSDGTVSFVPGSEVSVDSVIVADITEDDRRISTTSPPMKVGDELGYKTGVFTWDGSTYTLLPLARWVVTPGRHIHVIGMVPTQKLYLRDVTVNNGSYTTDAVTFEIVPGFGGVDFYWERPPSQEKWIRK